MVVQDLERTYRLGPVETGRIHEGYGKMSDKVQRMLENQRKREQTMKKKEEKRKKEEEEKKKKEQQAKPAVDPSTASSKAEKERLERELEYERAEAAKKKMAEERRKQEEEEREQRAAQMRADLLAGKDIHDVDWKKQQDLERRKAEIEKEKARKQMDKATTEKLKKAQAESQAKREHEGKTAPSEKPVNFDLSGAKDPPCMWGCKCPGFETQGTTKSGPEICKHCSHAKTLHHL